MRPQSGPMTEPRRMIQIAELEIPPQIVTGRYVDAAQLAAAKLDTTIAALMLICLGQYLQDSGYLGRDDRDDIERLWLAMSLGWTPPPFDD